MPHSLLTQLQRPEATELERQAALVIADQARQLAELDALPAPVTRPRGLSPAHALGYELMGVLTDLEGGKPFDATCQATVSRVMTRLLAKDAPALPS